MHHLDQAASRRNYFNEKPDHHERVDLLVELTAGGREMWRRTRRAPSTCNLLAKLAGLGSGESV